METLVHNLIASGTFGKNASPTLVAAIVIFVMSAVVFLGVAFPFAGIVSWAERRVWARIQSRVGPNRVGPNGFLQWLADGVKHVCKEDIIPDDSDPTLFKTAPYLVVLAFVLPWAVMPFSSSLILADLNVGILYMTSVTAITVVGVLMAGWASNDKWSLIGGIRSAAQIVSYEIPAGLSIFPVVLMTGTLSMQGIIRAQGWAPQHWFLFANPFTFVAANILYISALAEGNRAPFDLPEAESELVAGYSTEYSGMRYLFFFFAEWANVFVMCGIASALFLGGWQIPWIKTITPADQEASFGLQCLGAVVFQLKSWFLVFVVIWIRWTLPRVRIDQMMNLCWKWFVPASFFAFILTGVWVVWSPLPQVQFIVGVGMFAL